MKRAQCILYLMLLFLFDLSGAEDTFYADSDKSYPEIKQYIANAFDLTNQNWGISQNPINRKIYFANTKGLIEFNGIKFIQIKQPGVDAVRSVLVDRNGLIFSGSFEDFGYWSDTENCGLKYTSLATEISIDKNDEIWRIFELNTKIYFQSFTTIYVYDYDKVKKITAPFTMLFIFPVNQRFIAQIIDNGLFWFENDTFEFIQGSEKFNQKKIHGVIPLSNSNLLIATANDGLYQFDGSVFSVFKSEASSFLRYNICNTAMKLNDSLLAFGSILNGLIITDLKGNILNTFNRSNGLNNNTVLSLHKDLDHGLWIGLDEGVNYIELNSPYTHYSNTSGSLGTIYALLRSDEKLYIGTNHGLFEASIKSGAGNYQFSNLQFIPGSQGQVWTLDIIDGQILCGHNEGTFLLNNSSFIKISDVTGGWTIKKHLNSLFEGTYTGIAVFEKNEKESWKFKSKIEGFVEPVRYLEVDYLGYLWVSHYQKGLYRLELNETLDSVVSNEYYPAIDGKVSFLNVFKINNRIIFTNGENLFTYNYVERIISPLDELNNELGEYRASGRIIPFEKNQYWFIHENKIGLFEISTDFTITKKLEIIQKSSSLPERDISLIMLNENTLMISTRDCFDTYDIQLHSEVSPLNRINLEKILFYGKGKSEIACPVNQLIEASWFANNINVFFSDPSMFSQQSKFFLYRIPQIDTNWNITSTDNFSFLNLKHGDYTIEIKQDILPDKIYSYNFTIKSPWYLTGFAVIVYILFLIVLIFIIYRIFRYELNRQKELLEMDIKTENLESELDHKSYELMLTIRYLIHKNEILSELQKEINEVKEFSSKYPIKNLRNMERIISEGLDTQTDDWKNAMNNLKLSQQGFFKKLKDNFPDLTPNDLRLCSYLRMNFSTKEIARLLNISKRAVEISRYRLRKKMKLNHEKNLIDFLMSETFSESFGQNT